MHLDALRTYQQVVGVDRGHYRDWFNMGNSLAALDRGNEAVEAYRRALVIKPDLIPGYINLGVLLTERGEFERAAEVLIGGIQYAPGDDKLHVGLTMAYLKAGNRQAAHDHQRAFQKEDPALAEIIKSSLLGSEDEE